MMNKFFDIFQLTGLAFFIVVFIGRTLYLWFTQRITPLALGAGLALVGLAILSGLSGTRLLLAGLGAAIMLTAVYDRCPIYRMVSTRLKELLHKEFNAIIQQLVF